MDSFSARSSDASFCRRRLFSDSDPTQTNRARRADASSATWNSSSTDLADHSDTDDIDIRNEFVQEYNRLAKKHGIRTLDPEIRSPPLQVQIPPQQRRGWFSRTFLRQSSTSSDASSTKSDKNVKPRRSVSERALHLVNGTRRDTLKDEDLRSLVRLCGKSTLHLPGEYAPRPLILPTCFRATAQHLMQYGAETRGVFRIPGSVRVVNALYNYYCADGDVGEISDSICCPTLPSHIQVGTHDVASVFKRLLSGLPGGILGSLSLFDVLVAIHNQLRGELSYNWMKENKVKARLIALAICTVKSQLRRDLICAVFGLLSLIGRAAEEAPQQDEQGRPLLASDLMGYNALGIVFGPLLVGDLVNPPTAPPTMTKTRRKSKLLEGGHPPALAVDKIHVANSVTEMLIAHWREVVKQMKVLEGPRAARGVSQQRAGLPFSATASFDMRMPRSSSGLSTSSELTFPPSPTPQSGPGGKYIPSYVLPRRRPRATRPLSAHASAMASLLSPPAEELSPADTGTSGGVRVLGIEHDRQSSRAQPTANSEVRCSARPMSADSKHQVAPAQNSTSTTESFKAYHDMATPETQTRRRDHLTCQGRGTNSPRPLLAPRSPTIFSTPSKPQETEWHRTVAPREATSPFARRSYKENMAPEGSYCVRAEAERLRPGSGKLVHDTPMSTMRRLGRVSPDAKVVKGSFWEVDPRADIFERGTSGLPIWIPTRRSFASTDKDGFSLRERLGKVSRPPSPIRHDISGGGSGPAQPSDTQGKIVSRESPNDTPYRRQTTFKTPPPARPPNVSGSAVRTMAAMFESASKTSMPPFSSASKINTIADSRPSGMVSPYMVNPSPVTVHSKSPVPANLNGQRRHTWFPASRDQHPRGPREMFRGTRTPEIGQPDAGKDTPRTTRGKQNGVTGSPTSESTASTDQPHLQEEQPRQRAHAEDLHHHHHHQTPTAAHANLASSAAIPAPAQPALHRSVAAATTTPPQHISSPPTRSSSSASSSGPEPESHHRTSSAQQQQQQRRFPLLLPPTTTTTTTTTTPGEDQQYQKQVASKNLSSNSFGFGSLATEEPACNEDSAAAAAEVALLREQLRRMEEACAAWRARAEGAERRVRVLEGR